MVVNLLQTSLPCPRPYLVGVAILSLLYAGFIHAQSEEVDNRRVGNPAVVDNALLKVCVFTWQPFAYEKEGVLTGIMVDIARDTITRLGYQPEFHLSPPLRCLQGLHTRTMTVSLFTSNLSLNEARGNFLAVKPSVQYYLPSLFVRDDHPAKTMAGLDSLSGWRIGTVRGNPLARRYQQFSDITWVYVNQAEDIWTVLDSRRGEAILAGYQSHFLLDKARWKTHRILLPPISAVPVYWAVNRANADLAKRLGEQLRYAQSDGSLDTFYQNHLGVSFTKIKSMIDGKAFEVLKIANPLE